MVTTIGYEIFIQGGVRMVRGVYRRAGSQKYVTKAQPLERLVTAEANMKVEVKDSIGHLVNEHRKPRQSNGDSV